MKEIEQNLIDIIKYEVLGEGNPNSDSARPQIAVSAELYNIARRHEVAQLVADYLGCTNVKAESARTQAEPASTQAEPARTQAEPANTPPDLKALDPELTAQKEAEQKFRAEIAEQKFRAEIAEHYNAELYRALTFKTDLSRVSLILEREGIDYIPLKGAIIRDMYPKSWMRSSTDIDILVRPADLERAVSAITSEPGYMLVNKTDHHTLIESKTGWIIEVHFTLSRDGDEAKTSSNSGAKVSANNGAKKILDRAWDFATPISAASTGSSTTAQATVSPAPERATHRYNFTDEFFEFYFYFHLAHHARKQGALGLRQMLDVFVLAGKSGSTNRLLAKSEPNSFGKSGSTNRLLAKSGLDRFAEVARTIAQVWFGGLAPKKAAKQLGISEEELEEIETFAFDGGIAGSPESKKTMQKLSGRRRTLGDQLGRMSRIFRPGTAAKIKKEIELAGTIGDNEVDRARRVLKNLGL